jgi:predicted nucleic acid-binding protein
MISDLSGEPDASRGVLDTSAFIATETGRQLDESLIPAEVATTVITLAELSAGVLAATSSDIRAQRLATLESVAVAALPVDEEAARMWRGYESSSPRPADESVSTTCGSRPSLRHEHFR